MRERNRTGSGGRGNAPGEGKRRAKDRVLALRLDHKFNVSCDALQKAAHEACTIGWQSDASCNRGVRGPKGGDSIAADPARDRTST